MITLFVLSLPLLAFSLIALGGKDLLASYVTTGMLMFYIFMKKKDTKIYFPKEAKAFLCFIIYVFLFSLLNIYFGGGADKNLTQMLITAMYFMFYMLLINIFSSFRYKQAAKYINIFIFICFMASLYSIFQFFMPNSDILGGFLRNANKSFVITSQGFRMVGMENFGRVSGFAPEPSMWAAFLAVPLALMLPRLYFSMSARKLLLYLVILSAFIMTYGRTGWLAFILAILLLPIFILKGVKRKVAIVFVSFFIAIGLIGMAYFGAQGLDGSVIERLQGQMTAVNMFRSNPVFGVGLGGFSINKDLYAPAGSSVITRDTGNYAYNLYIRLLAETGIVGTLLWLIFIKTIWDRYYSFYVSNVEILRDNNIKSFLIGLGLAYFTIIFSWINIEGFNFMYIWFVLSLMSCMPTVISKNMNQVPKQLKTKD